MTRTKSEVKTNQWADLKFWRHKRENQGGKRKKEQKEKVVDAKPGSVGHTRHLGMKALPRLFKCHPRS
jgi:hypothetical protein